MIPAASTPKAHVFASKKRLFGSLLGILALGFFTVLAKPITGYADNKACVPEKGVLDAFQPTTPPRAIPDAKVIIKDGSERALSYYKGKGIILNFWATWCAPCVREMPQLDRLAALVRENGIEVLTVSEDRLGLEKAAEFYTENKLTDLPLLVDPKMRVLKAMGVRGLPSTILINAEGMEIGRVIGVAEWDSIEAVGFIRKCLKGRR